MWIPINPMRYCIIDNLYIMVEFVGECLLTVSGCRIFWGSWLVRMQVSGSGCGNVFTVCIDWLITRQMYSHRQCTHSTCVHTDTPEVPQAVGGEETLLPVDGLGAYVCTKSGTTQSWIEWEYFGISINVALVGRAKSEMVQQYWQERQLCSEIFKKRIHHGHYEQGWLISITLSFLNVTYTRRSGILSKPNPNSNSIQLGLRLDTVLTANPPTTRYHKLLDHI